MLLGLDTFEARRTKRNKGGQEARWWTRSSASILDKSQHPAPSLSKSDPTASPDCPTHAKAYLCKTASLWTKNAAKALRRKRTDDDFAGFRRASQDLSVHHWRPLAWLELAYGHLFTVDAWALLVNSQASQVPHAAEPGHPRQHVQHPAAGAGSLTSHGAVQRRARTHRYPRCFTLLLRFALFVTPPPMKLTLGPRSAI